MIFDAILTDAEYIADVFAEGYSSIRLNVVSCDELETLNRIVSANKGIMLIALPHEEDCQARE